MKSKYFLIVYLMTMTAGLSSCVDDEFPTDQITTEQVALDPNAQLNVLYGISAYMVKYNAYGSSSYYYNDWGYPSEMFYRDLCTQDFVYSKNGTLNYWTYKEDGSSTGYDAYRWNFYYRLIKNCNSLIGIIDETTANDDSKRYLAQAMMFRAMAYMDLAREFEFKPTGYDDLDLKADNNGIWGLTVPIVTSNMSLDEIQDNERAHFFTLYRFVMTDLNKAIQLMGEEYMTDDKSLPDSYVAFGLMARAWLEIGSRMDPSVETSSQLNAFSSLASEYDKVNNGYDKLNVTTASECYANAITAASKVIEGGQHSIMTKDDWQSKTNGFNTANNSWMWRCRIGQKEQQPAYYFSFAGTVCSEPLTGLPYSYHAFRCISSTLFDEIESNDWRKLSWISPTDAGKGTKTIINKYNSLLDETQFKELDEYANLKFRPGQGDIDVVKNWMIGDLPVMRIEEMYYIKAEAEARSGDLGQATQTLETVVSARYNRGYTCSSASLSAFVTELMKHKRIEFWGEGLTFFDYKRLNLKIDRTKITNTLETNKIASKDGYCAPWLNLFIYSAETGRNNKCKPNPDSSGYHD